MGKSFFTTLKTNSFTLLQLEMNTSSTPSPSFVYLAVRKEPNGDYITPIAVLLIIFLVITCLVWRKVSIANARIFEESRERAIEADMDLRRRIQNETLTIELREYRRRQRMQRIREENGEETKEESEGI